MKKIYLLLSFFFITNTVFSKTNATDDFLQKVKLEKNDDKKIDLILSYFALPSNESEFTRAQIAQKLLQYSYKYNDKIAEVLGLKEISFFYVTSDKTSDGLAICLKALKIAEKIRNEKLIGYVNVTLGFFYNDFNKSNSIYKKCLAIANKINDDNLRLETYKNLSQVYLDNNLTTKSLEYTQKEYELTLKLKKFQDLGYTYLGFAEIHKRLKNKELALSYYNMAINAAKKLQSKRQMGWAYNYKGVFFLEENNLDSAKVYAQKAITTFDKSVQKDGGLTSVNILLEIYRKTNIDSAFKYSEKLRTGILNYIKQNNSIDNFKLKLDEELRQKKIADENEKLEEEKKQNIQYTFISIGILVLLTTYLILSRSFIVSNKLIKYIGIVSLLIVFEFINLLIHPFLEKITHHSPILILLALVIIAAILVPLHHKVEHLLVAKLIEKNKKLKLKKAITIIEEEEEEEDKI